MFPWMWPGIGASANPPSKEQIVNNPDWSRGVANNFDESHRGVLEENGPGDLGRAKGVAGRGDDAGIGAERFRGLAPDLLK
jgi:hypothetical protein